MKGEHHLRIDGRRIGQLRPIAMETNYVKHAEGSVFITVGDTKVICTASIEERVPPFMRGEGKGWITAEYSMLPRATEQRTIREAARGKISGRTMEIQRLIGRALRAVVDLKALGERTIWIDCDVIQADGGTRTAAITGAFVALVQAIETLNQEKELQTFPIKDFLAATSVGIVNEHGTVLDLNYEEDRNALVDMNIVMTGAGEFVELQGTGEESTFSYTQLQELVNLAQEGINTIFDIQRQVLGEIGNKIAEQKNR